MSAAGVPAGLAKTPLIDRSGLMTQRWLFYFRDQSDTVAQGPTRVVTAGATNQTASISTTPFSTDALAAGLYRVTWYVRVTTPATTSSSVEVVLSWTDGAIAQSVTGTAVTGNTTTSLSTQSALIHIDQSTPISYATTYASNAANEMAYALYLTLESLGQG